MTHVAGTCRLPGAASQGGLCPLLAHNFQALPLLKSRFPIERARMRLKLLVPLSCKDELLELVRAQGGVLEEQDLIGGWRDRCGQLSLHGELGRSRWGLKGGMRSWIVCEA